jgi:Chaperone of endosialidase
MNRWPLRAGLLLIPFALAWFALSPQARATCQEGCLANFNTVLGDDALINNTGFGSNTAIGFNALYSNTTGFGNTAVGYVALFSNTTGVSNTAVGYNALPSNTTGIENTANGVSALSYNTAGAYNTAIGAGTLGYNTTGDSNTATGFAALEFNTASFNTANGGSALELNTTGNSNTANGYEALYRNRTGSNNVALGFQAGARLTTGSDNIYVGNTGLPSESNTIRIGKQGSQRTTFIAGISGATIPTGVPVIVDSGGHLGTTTSSARFKEAIKPMDKASEAILALKPVAFRYKHELDPSGIPQFGLVAEDVEKVNSDLVARDDQGKAYTVRYDAVNAMLLNEFLKEHKAFVEEQRKVQEQGATIARLEQQIEALTIGLQKVSAQLELSKSAPQTVLNNR